MLKKKHPNSKRSTLQKQAGREFKSGKLKKRKVSGSVGAARPKKKKRVVRKRRVARKKARVITRTRIRTVVKRKYIVRRPAKKKSKKRGRVSGKGKSMVPLLIGAAALFAAWMIFSKKSTPPLILTGNIQRDNTASNIIAYVTAAGASAAAIANLIKQINAGNATQVSQLDQQVKTKPTASDLDLAAALSTVYG